MLGDSIGLPWPRSGPLVVQEAVSRSTGGYAGLFDPTRGLVEIAYYASDFVVLHEAAHSWFNGALLADRWANEAFASYYGLDAAATLKVKAKGDEMTKALEKARIPLNDWGAVGREPTLTEDYAYAATLALARAIAERAGPDGLRAVWADAAGRVGAYQPPGAAASAASVGTATPELVDGPPDWRGLLDLLEARTGASYDDLWRTWVARDTDLPLLDARAAARGRYDAVVAQAGDWRLPRQVRDAMRAWQFDDATTLLDEASRALAQRTAVERDATAAGLTLPTAIRSAFEDDDGLADVYSRGGRRVRGDRPVPGSGREPTRRRRSADGPRPARRDPGRRPRGSASGVRQGRSRRVDGRGGCGHRRLVGRRGPRPGSSDQPRDPRGRGRARGAARVRLAARSSSAPAPDARPSDQALTPGTPRRGNRALHSGAPPNRCRRRTSRRTRPQQGADPT